MLNKVKALLLVFFLILLILVSYLLFWPVRDDIATWQMQPRPNPVGVLEANDILSSAEKFGPKLPWGNEDITLGPDGMLYTSTQEGKIMRLSPDGQKAELYAEVGGQLLGIAFDEKGNLYIANSTKGLQRVSPEGQVETLLTEVEGRPIAFAEEVTVAKDGMVYLTDGSYKHRDIYMLIAQQPTGRVIAYNPKTGQAKEIMTGLRFANGLVLSHDENSLLVNELGFARIWRYWLKGEKAGQSELFLERAPGSPDNISRGSKGLYWVALYDDSQGVMNLSRSMFYAKIVARMPTWLALLLTPNTSAVIALNDQAEIVHYFQDGKRIIPNVTTALEHKGWLYLGNVTADFIYRLKIDEETS